MLIRITFLLVLVPALAWANGKVGLILPFSGPVAEYGAAFRNGIELADRDHPKLLGGIEWIYEDSKYESALAVSAFRKLVSADGVDLAYVFGGPMSEAVAPLAESGRTPLLVSINEPKVAKGRKFVIRFSNPADDYGKLLVEWFRSRGIKRAAVVKVENQYINCMLDGLTRALPADLNLEVISAFQPGEMDFRSVVSRLKNNRYDAVGVYLLPGQISSFYKQAAQQSLKGSFFGADFLESISEIGQSGEAIEGTVYPNNTVSEEFAARYLKEFGNDNQITWAGYGYDFAVTAAKALKVDGTTGSADALIAALRSSQASKGILGPAAFVSSSDDSYFRFPVVLKRISQGRIVEDRLG